MLRIASPDVCIAGAGIIGLSLALELHDRGLTVGVFDRGSALSEASTAAAGMLAVEDPHNPAPLRPLSELSRRLYPAFLDRLRALSGQRVSFGTRTTLQSIAPGSSRDAPAGYIGPRVLSLSELHQHLPTLEPGRLHFTLLEENSLDPRDLAAALLAAIHLTSIDLREHTPVLAVHSEQDAVSIQTSSGPLHCGRFVDCTGAWSFSSSSLPHLAVLPRKGQMLSVHIPPALQLQAVVRTPEIYIVPRTAGTHTGQAIIGATVEDAGFDKSVLPSTIAGLHAVASSLLPPLSNAPVLQSWSGLRPSTTDGLPVLGFLTPEGGAAPGLRLIAGGHFRNGVLLAPATARVIADLLTGRPAALDLLPFSPQRRPANSTG